MKIQLDLNATRIEIPTDTVLKEVELVDSLNSLSSHISNQIGKPVTIWHFNDASKVLQAVLKLQEADVPFLWIEERLQAVIIAYGTMPEPS